MGSGITDEQLVTATGGLDGEGEIYWEQGMIAMDGKHFTVFLPDSSFIHAEVLPILFKAAQDISQRSFEAGRKSMKRDLLTAVCEAKA